ncbi:hypothetical protein ACQPZX_29435 [Actinoplanes sp. CA-142083]|uniref:hypothetical protein n=1 Tax=Actinoplanes sp. CA-142083 TaxID=3239903 RepID=UPI003D8BBCD8
MTPDKNARPGRRSETGAKQAGPADASVLTWAEVYDDAERWISWTARRRWPDFAVNDQVWACSITAWELHGRRSAA